MMKKILVLAFIAVTLCAHSQSKSSVETRALAQAMSGAKSVSELPKSLTDRYPIRYQGEEPCIGVVAKVSQGFEAAEIEALGGKVTSQVADIVSMRMPLRSLPMMDNCKGILQYTVAHKVSPTCDKTRADTRTDSVQRGLGLPQAFNGQGVIIGITDWGFDYRHPNINSDAERRILGAWDMYKLSGPAPEGFDYGTEYKTYDELYEAGGDTSGLYGYHSHGTHVAGISGGRGTKAAGNSNSKYIGQAPKAQFLLGSWLLDEASWLDQVAWMSRVAKAEGKRLVINSSWGMYNFSTLDGTSLVSQAINHYSDSGIVFVTSGGNNGDEQFHLQHTFGANDTVKTMAAWYGGGIGQNIICWGEAGKQFQVGFYLMDRNLHDTLWVDPFSTAENIAYREGILVAATGDTIRYDVMTESCNMNDSRSHLLLNVSKINSYKLVIYSIGEEGSTVHYWNLCNLENNAGNMGTAFQNGGIFGCQNGDAYYGVGEPGCADKTITVAAHNADTWKPDSTYNPGNIASFSSYGPRLDGVNKPEISAPGVNVVSSVSSRDASQTTAVAAISANGTSYKYATMSGTSMSSPAVTGVVALMLQANPNITVDKIREILFATARNDERTGALQANDSISIRWGHGKVDALRAVGAAFDLLSIDEAIARVPELVVYPNPAADGVHVVTGSDEPALLQVYGIDGRKVCETTVRSEATLNTAAWRRGVYVVRVQDRTGIRTSKLVVEN